MGRFRAFSFPFPESVLVSLAYLSSTNCYIAGGTPWIFLVYTSTTGFWHNRAATHIHFPTTEDKITEYFYFWALPASLPGLLRRNPLPAMRRMDVRTEENSPLPGAVKTTSLVIQMSPLRYVIVIISQSLRLRVPAPDAVYLVMTDH